MICYIIGAGDVDTNTGFTAKKDDFIICADGGYRHKSLLGRDCDLVVGDFDSLGAEPDFEKKIVLPCEKDFTDMKIAVDEGLKRGYRDFIIFGALGGERFDHSVANIALLSYICSKNATGRLIHSGKIFHAFSNGTITLPKQKSGYVSVFSLCDESKGVTIQNLKYNVSNISLRLDTPVGVSNEFTGEQGTVSVKDGRLLVIYNDSDTMLN